ncbi:MAG TPA: heme exporter protein CcmD [Methyloversatilis sp.]
MNWESAGQFWAMGGYGFFVWSSYAVTAVLVAAELIALSRRMRRARALAARDLALERMDSGKRGRT